MNSQYIYSTYILYSFTLFIYSSFGESFEGPFEGAFEGPFKGSFEGSFEEVIWGGNI